ncbi:hypothetical protein WDU94_001026 [Cyamophila willieti]
MDFSRVGVILVLLIISVISSTSSRAQESTSDITKEAGTIRNIDNDTQNSSSTNEDTAIDSSTETRTTTKLKGKEKKYEIETLNGLYTVLPKNKYRSYRKLDPMNTIHTRVIETTSWTKDAERKMSTPPTDTASNQENITTSISTTDTELEKPTDKILARNDDETNKSFEQREMEQNTTTDSKELTKGALTSNTNITTGFKAIEQGALESNTNTAPDSEELETGALESNTNNTPDSEKIETGAPERNTNTTPDFEKIETGALESNTNTTLDSEKIEKEGLESNNNTTTDSGELNKEALESNNNTTTDSEELNKEALSFKQRALESNNNDFEELDNPDLESNTKTSVILAQRKHNNKQKGENTSYKHKEDKTESYKTTQGVKMNTKLPSSIVPSTTVIPQYDETYVQQIDVTVQENIDSTEEMTTQDYDETKEIEENTSLIPTTTTQEEYTTITIRTTPRKQKTIYLERVENSNYVPKNDKYFLQYPSLRKIPPEKDTTNNYTTPTISTTRTSYKTREPSTWMTFLTTPKPKPTTNVPIVSSTILASTTTRHITSTDSNGQGTYNLNKLVKSKTNNGTKSIEIKSNLIYQNVTEETSPKDAAIQKLLMFIIECKASNNDSKCETSKSSNDPMTKMLYDNELYKLTGDKNYNKTLNESVAQLEKSKNMRRNN